MKRLVALLLLFAVPAFAADGEVTILRGTPAPPTPWYQPPPPPPAPSVPPAVVYQPVIYPPFYYVPFGGSVAGPQQRIPDGWPLFRR